MTRVRIEQPPAVVECAHFGCRRPATRSDTPAQATEYRYRCQLGHETRLLVLTKAYYQHPEIDPPTFGAGGPRTGWRPGQPW